jgi:transcriptional regulator GlxA family with amidase domain
LKISSARPEMFRSTVFPVASFVTSAISGRIPERLRVRLALERLGEGERCLARLAADLGFADQAHLSRVMRREVGAAPSHLRPRLSAGF